MNQEWWEEVVKVELDAEDIEAKEALLFLVDRLGSEAKAARFLKVDQRLVNRNVHRAREGKGLTSRMKAVIENRLQVIPGRRSDNPIERMAWLVEHLDRDAKIQRRATIEVRDRIAALEVHRQGPPATWYAEMDTAKRETEKAAREMALETQKIKEERDQYMSDMEDALTLVVNAYDMISKAVMTQVEPVEGFESESPRGRTEMDNRLRALSQNPEFQHLRGKFQEMLAKTPVIRRGK